MRPESTKAFRDPSTGSGYTLRADVVEDGLVIEGALVGAGGETPIRGGIPRFVPAQNYADSFGYQWQHFAKTQLDSSGTWNEQSEVRLYAETGWSRDLEGQRILEAGSGMGRFTEILARTGAEVQTFDYSAAISANRVNVGDRSGVSFAQADIYAPPYEHASFDKVLCIGVIQHCPDPEGAFKSLCRFLAPGGEIVVDIYRLNWKSVFYGKYYVRPFVRSMTTRELHDFVRRHVDRVFLLTGELHKMSHGLGRKLSTMLAVADHRGLYELDDAAARESSELDTFDALAPAFDKPQTLRRVRSWLESAGLEDIEVKPGYNGLEARGRRPTR